MTTLELVILNTKSALHYTNDKGYCDPNSCSFVKAGKDSLTCRGCRAYHIKECLTDALEYADKLIAELRGS